jgi:hypothetical protein
MNMLPAWSGCAPSAPELRGMRWVDPCCGAGSTSALPSTDFSMAYGAGKAVHWFSGVTPASENRLSWSTRRRGRQAFA